MFDNQEKEEAQRKADQIKDNVKSSTNGNDDAISVKQEASVFADIVNVKVTTKSGRQTKLYTDGQNIGAHGDAELGNQATSAAQGGGKINQILESGSQSSPMLDQAYQLLDASILSDKEKTELLAKTSPTQFKSQEEYLTEIKQKLKTKEAEAHTAKQASEDANSNNKDGKKEKDPSVEAMNDAYAKIIGHRGIEVANVKKEVKGHAPENMASRTINNMAKQVFRNMKKRGSK